MANNKRLMSASSFILFMTVCLAVLRCIKSHPLPLDSHINPHKAELNISYPFVRTK